MANAHSHAFQRGLRGAGERPTATGADDFWTWREVMYGLAAALDPDTMHASALTTFREMRAAGYGAVGEFHYVHHQPDGTPYADPNAMARAVTAAADEAGIRLVLLPAAYHRGGHPRFRDADVDAFLARVGELAAPGVAAHSVRAVPREWLEAIAAFADERGIVRHAHAAEQPREVEACRAEHGCSPIELLHDTGFLGPRTSIVHGIHVSERDVELLAQTGTTVVSCPTTEGNLGDGWPPALRYRDAGVPLAVGSDSHVRLDPFEEVRELETAARREGLTRSALLPPDGNLWGAVARAGAAALGLEPDELGTIEIDPEAPELSGVAPEDLPWAISTCASARVVSARR